MSKYLAFIVLAVASSTSAVLAAPSAIAPLPKITWPGTQAFIWVDRLLEPCLNDKDKDFTLRMRACGCKIDKELENKNHAATLKNALHILRIMRGYFKKNVCDARAAVIYEMALQGALGTEYQKFENKHVKTVVFSYFTGTLDTCRQTFAPTLASLMEAFDATAKGKLENFLNKDFVSRYEKVTENMADRFKLGQMLVATETTRKMKFPIETTSLIATRLLEVVAPVLADTPEIDHNGTKWKRLTYENIMDFMKDMVSGPCDKFVKQVGLPVMKLHYLGAKFVDKYREKVLQDLTDETKLGLFHYEFCQTRSGSQLYNDVWNWYEEVSGLKHEREMIEKANQEVFPSEARVLNGTDPQNGVRTVWSV